ncbi:sensor histidine kinase [Demequina sediminicola]|uniref:sensor histidine kinase n=1 Tax=Demequina sediminicola TaxID=1095026 RepID=UPI0007830FC8|nr:ATP-binding protein [Demequina sediminicola]
MATSGEHAARERVQRMLYFASGIGALVFGYLLVPGSSGIASSYDQIAPWYWWFAMAVAVAVPASFILIAFLLPLRVLHAIALFCVGGFLVAELLWVPAMHDLTLDENGTPWLHGINALPSTLAGVVIRSRAAWVVPVSQLFLVPIGQLSASNIDVTDAVLNGCGAIIFCSILTAMASAVVGAGGQLDRTTAEAKSLAAADATARAREREHARINAIVHDDVMSVLLTAGRSGVTDEVRTQARNAQQSIRTMADTDGPTTRTYTPEQFQAAIRATTADAGMAVDVTLPATSGRDVPGAVVEAVSEAVAEALRNCGRHAGEGARVTVESSVTDSGVVVEVMDDGQGFDPKATDPGRLGIAVSIGERMQQLPGGSSRVESRPGAGTTVTLGWVHP